VIKHYYRFQSQELCT